MKINEIHGVLHRKSTNIGDVLFGFQLFSGAKSAAHPALLPRAAADAGLRAGIRVERHLAPGQVVTFRCSRRGVLRCSSSFLGFAKAAFWSFWGPEMIELGIKRI